MSVTRQPHTSSKKERAISRSHRFSRLPVLLALALLLAAGGESYVVRVTRVFDGDSFEALYDNKVPVGKGVRLFGVDAPEKGQPYYLIARDFTSKLIYQKNVTIIPRDTDKYGRVVADVILPDGRSLNEELVKAGLAWWYRQYAPDNKKLAGLEAAARTGKAGLWSESNPIPPWDWRHKNETVTVNDAGGFCASRNSKVYHACSCETVSTINPENLVRFKTEQEAQKSGRHRCKCQK